MPKKPRSARRRKNEISINDNGRDTEVDAEIVSTVY